MTTSTVTSVIDHSTDAGFRTWVAEHIAQCLAVGLTQTSDTGQINTTTVVRGSTSTDAGYAIFRFNDSTQSTAPVFIKFYYGTGAISSLPRIRVQVGTASSGAGVISGTGSANTDTITSSSGSATGGTSYPSYYCYTGGCFWFGWKYGFQSSYVFGFAQFQRSTDSTQASTTDALATTYTSTSSAFTIRTVSFLTSTIYNCTSVANFAQIFYAVTSSVVGGVPQVYKTYCITPRVQPLLGSLLTLVSEVGVGTTFTDTPFGTTSRTYLVCNTWSTTSIGFACLWE